MPSAKEKKYMGLVAKLGCAVNDYNCSNILHVHHKIGHGRGQYKASPYDTIPLCSNHHLVSSPLGEGHSVHNNTLLFEANYGTQDEMILRTQRKVALMDATFEFLLHY